MQVRFLKLNFALLLLSVSLTACGRSTSPVQTVANTYTGLPQTATGQTANRSTYATMQPANTSAQPIQGGRAVATANGYAYQADPASTQANPYAGMNFPSGSYGSNYGMNSSTPTYTGATGTAGYGSAYGTGAAYGTSYATAPNAAAYGTGTYGAGTAYGTGYATAPNTTASYGSYAAPNRAQGSGYIQYNVAQAQQNQAKR